MLKQALLFWAAACCCAILTASAFALPDTAVESTLVLKVADKDLAAQTLIKKAAQDGGYFISQTDDGVRLKIPATKSESYISFVESQGIVIGRKYEAVFVGDELAKKEASLKAREKIHGQYLEVLQNAGADAVFLVEKEIVGLIREIETLKGEINFLKYRLQFADIVVEFQFRDRSAPAVDGNSSFPWLNSMNLVDLLKDF